MHDELPLRVALVEAAAASFAARGFEETTMQAIADRAGLPLATAIEHYPSKYAYAIALYQSVVADVAATLPDLPQGPIAVRFASLVSTKLDRLDMQRSAMRALLAAAVDAKGPIGVLATSTAALRARMSGAVRVAVMGATDASMDPDRVATMLYGLHLAIVLLWTQDEDGRMARGMVAFARNLLGALGPALALPGVDKQLEQFESVFGDRLAPVVGADVERRARWILARLMHHRRLLPGADDRPPTEEQLAPHLPIVRTALVEGRPLELLLPAFPAKSPNLEKVVGTLPDMGERVALRLLQSLCDELSEAHPPGVGVTVCSDGLVFADVVSVTDEDVVAYGAEIDRLLRPLPRLTRFDLAHAFGAMTPDDARRRLLASWGESETALLALAETSAALRAQLDGLHRFMFEDGVVLSPDVSRSQVRKQARGKAVEVLRRSRAWGRLLATIFPRALRLSIHPQPLVSDKIGIHLLPTRDAWLTPWHGVALLESDRFRLVKRSEAEAMGATCVDEDGRPSHYAMPS